MEHATQTQRHTSNSNSMQSTSDNQAVHRGVRCDAMPSNAMPVKCATSGCTSCRQEAAPCSPSQAQPQSCAARRQPHTTSLPMHDCAMHALRFEAAAPQHGTSSTLCTLLCSAAGVWSGDSMQKNVRFPVPRLTFVAWLGAPNAQKSLCETTTMLQCKCMVHFYCRDNSCS